VFYMAAEEPLSDLVGLCQALDNVVSDQISHARKCTDPAKDPRHVHLLNRDAEHLVWFAYYVSGKAAELQRIFLGMDAPAG